MVTNLICTTVSGFRIARKSVAVEILFWFLLDFFLLLLQRSNTMSRMSVCLDGLVARMLWTYEQICFFFVQHDKVIYTKENYDGSSMRYQGYIYGFLTAISMLHIWFPHWDIMVTYMVSSLRYQGYIYGFLTDISRLHIWFPHWYIKVTYMVSSLRYPG